MKPSVSSEPGADAGGSPKDFGDFSFGGLIVLMSDRLQNIVFALDLARQARRVIYENLIFAMSVILVLVVSALGFELALPIGVIGHEGSTVLVCLNGLRMLAYRSRGD
jgi:Cd2+/Zn2+-exporting ATPase